MTYRINFNQYANHFALPQEIVSDDIAEMDALYLKTALLIFKNADKHYSVNLLSNLLGQPEKRIEEALSYWVRRGLLIEDKQAEPAANVAVLSKRTVQQRRENTPPELTDNFSGGI